MQRLYQRKYVRSRFQNAVRKLKGGLGAQILQDRANGNARSPLPEEPGSVVVYGGLAAVPEGDHEEECDHHSPSHSVHTPPRSRLSMSHVHPSPHSTGYLSPRSHLHQNSMSAEDTHHQALDSKISAGLMSLMNVEVSHHDNEVLTKALHSMENILEGSAIGSALGIHSSPNHHGSEDHVTDFAPIDEEPRNEPHHHEHHHHHHHHHNHRHHHHHHRIINDN